VVAGYALTFAAFMLTGGKLADLFGRRLVFMPGLAVFAGASLACGLAPNGADRRCSARCGRSAAPLASPSWARSSPPACPAHFATATHPDRLPARLPPRAHRRRAARAHRRDRSPGHNPQQGLATHPEPVAKTTCKDAPQELNGATCPPCQPTGGDPGLAVGTFAKRGQAPTGPSTCLQCREYGSLPEFAAAECAECRLCR